MSHTRHKAHGTGLHLAAALDLGDELEHLVTYDDRQARAAAASGVIVVSPGR